MLDAETWNACYPVGQPVLWCAPEGKAITVTTGPANEDQAVPVKWRDGERRVAHLEQLTALRRPQRR